MKVLKNFAFISYVDYNLNLSKNFALEFSDSFFYENMLSSGF